MAVKPRSGIYVAEIKRRYKDRVYTTFLLRRSYREDGKVKQQTLGNLSALPPHALAILRDLLHGHTYLPDHQAFECTRTRLYGHVAAIGAMIDRLNLPRLLDPQPSRERDLAVALLTARLAQPLTKLATTRWWQNTTLVDVPEVAEATDDDLYAALDWLGQRQSHIEQGLARRHLQDGGLVLYDLSSSYVEDNHCPLAAFGHNRDDKHGRRQVNYGLVLDAQGRPIAIEVFAGNVGDPKTVASQLTKLKQRFHLAHVALAGDRGMLTAAQIRTLPQVGGIDWISALRAKETQDLAKAGTIQLSLFDQRNLVEVSSPAFPGERLIVCRNPLLAEDRARTRDELLAATEAGLQRLQRRVAAGRLKQQAKIGEALGRIKNRFKMAKHFQCTVAQAHFSFKRRQDSIRRGAELDGIYVIRTSLPEPVLPAEQAVLGYTRLSRAERAFRTFKSVDIRVRPIHHWTEPRVRAHFLLGMLAYYVEWHLRQAWQPFLFDDETPGAHQDGSPVKPALRSDAAIQKARAHQTPEGSPVHSFQTLLAELSTVARNTWRVPARPNLPPFTAITVPTPFQAEVFRRVGLNVGPDCRQKDPV